MKALLAILILASIPALVWFAFTMPVVGGPTTIGGLYLEFMIIDAVFGLSKPRA